jgi:signal transduction histidine kinase
MENIKLLNDKGQIIYSNIKSECNKCIERCPVGKSIIDVSFCDKQKRKRYLEETNSYQIYFCTSNKDFINSNRLFNDKIEILKSFVPFIEEMRDDITNDINKENKRLLHNVTSLNGHNIQEIYSVVDQNLLSQAHLQQKELIIEKIKGDLDQAARMFLRIAKNNAAMKTEFAVFRKLLEPKPLLLFKMHRIHKVLLNILHVFFQDFSEQNIYVKIDPNDLEVFIDYESIQVAFYHFFDNATKYCLPKTEIFIKFKKGENRTDVIVSIEMTSLEIKSGENKKIFEEGYSGENARKIGIAGDGLGMYVLNRVLDLNKVSLKILPHAFGKKIHFKQAYFCKNIFLFTFSKNM